MILGVAAAACVAAFVVCSFALRIRMQRLTRAYRTRMTAIAQIRVNIDELEREMLRAAGQERVMRSNEMLFRTLWPAEYDQALHAAQHFIAQSSREVARASRPG